MDVATRTGGGDLDEHAATVSHEHNNPNNDLFTKNVPPQQIRRYAPKSLFLQERRRNRRLKVSNSGGPARGFRARICLDSHRFATSRPKVGQGEHCGDLRSGFIQPRVLHLVEAELLLDRSERMLDLDPNAGRQAFNFIGQDVTICGFFKTFRLPRRIATRQVTQFLAPTCLYTL